MSIEVSFYATLRAIAGCRSVALTVPEGSTVMDLARLIGGRWPELGERMIAPDGTLTRQVHILVNGRNIRWLPEGAATRLAPDHTVDLFPPTAGG